MINERMTFDQSEIRASLFEGGLRGLTIINITSLNPSSRREEIHF